MIGRTGQVDTHAWYESWLDGVSRLDGHDANAAAGEDPSVAFRLEEAMSRHGREPGDRTVHLTGTQSAGA